MTQKFIVIMGAGRCGSSSLISYLNKKPDFNIFGENHGAICYILESIHRLNLTKHYSRNSPNASSHDPNHKYTKKVYCGHEWYNNKENIDIAVTKLQELVKDFFTNHNQYKFIGYKDIRWTVEYLPESMKILEHIFKDVRYIHLTRDIDLQSDSMKRANFKHTNMTQTINDINDNISLLLKQKPKSQYIQKNITTDNNFLEEIYQFLIS